MGEMADMLLDQAWDFDPDDHEFHGRGIKIPTKFWVTRDGEKIRISKMTDSHLENAINLFERKGFSWFIPALYEEREKRNKICEEKRQRQFKKQLQNDPIAKAFYAGWCASKNWYCDEELTYMPTKKINLMESWEKYNSKHNKL